MLYKTEGIVLNHTRYAESNAIVHIFTRELGMQSYMVNGVFGKRKGDKAVLLSPLSLLQLEVYHRERVDIQRIKEFKLERQFERLPFVQERRAQVFFITEILSRVLRNENCNYPLYDFINGSVLLLDAGRDGLENFHLLFLFRLTGYLGFLPNGERGDEFSFFDLHNGCFVAYEPQHPFFLAPSDARLFSRFFGCGDDTLGELACNVGERRSLLKSILALFDCHFPGLGKIRSVEVLPSLF